MKLIPACLTALVLALSLGFESVSAGSGASAEASPKAKQGPGEAGVAWQGFDDGLREAARKGKYSFVAMYTDWCGYCRKMDMTTFRDRAVISKLSKNFVSIKFNAESEAPVTWKGAKLSQAELATQLGVEGFPTLLFLNPKGDIIGNFPSYADSDLMMKLLGYIASGSREKGLTFDDYLKKGAS